MEMNEGGRDLGSLKMGLPADRGIDTAPRAPAAQTCAELGAAVRVRLRHVDRGGEGLGLWAAGEMGLVG